MYNRFWKLFPSIGLNLQTIQFCANVLVGLPVDGNIVSDDVFTLTKIIILVVDLLNGLQVDKAC